MGAAGSAESAEEGWPLSRSFRASGSAQGGQAMLKLLPVLAIGPVANSLFWGQAFPAGVPAFAVKTKDDDSQVGYFDPLAFTGVRRGARATGVNAAVEGLIRNQSLGKIGSAAGKDLIRSGWHLVAGPPVQAAHTVATGENAMGHRVVPHTPPGQQNYGENALAAAKNANPMIAGFTGADRPKRPRTWIENILQSFGPFNPLRTAKKP